MIVCRMDALNHVKRHAGNGAGGSGGKLTASRTGARFGSKTSKSISPESRKRPAREFAQPPPAPSGRFPAENVNYAVKSGLLLTFLESAPEIAAKLGEPNNRERPFEDTVATVQKASALVLVYR